MSILSSSAGENRLNLGVSQLVTSIVAVDILAASANMETLRTSVLTSLLGQQETALHHEITYHSGEMLESIGHLTLWRETYATAVNIRKT